MLDQTVGWGAAFLAGIITFISPCVLPLLPVFIAFVAGVTVQDLAGGAEGAAGRVRAGAFWNTLAFVLGFSAVFVLLGATATMLGQSLFTHQKAYMRAGGAAVALFGLLMTGLLPLPFLARDLRFHLREKPAGRAGSFVVGAAFAFGWTPCVGLILGSILLLAGAADTVRQGMGLLAVYSAGLAVPFLASALLLNRVLRLLGRARFLLAWTERLAGAALVAVGVLVATEQFTRLTGWLLQAFEPWVDWLITLGI